MLWVRINFIQNMSFCDIRCIILTFLFMTQELLFSVTFRAYIRKIPYLSTNAIRISSLVIIVFILVKIIADLHFGK